MLPGNRINRNDQNTSQRNSYNINTPLNAAHVTTMTTPSMPSIYSLRCSTQPIDSMIDNHTQQNIPIEHTEQSTLEEEFSDEEEINEFLFSLECSNNIETNDASATQTQQYATITQNIASATEPSALDIERFLLYDDISHPYNISASSYELTQNIQPTIEEQINTLINTLKNKSFIKQINDIIRIDSEQLNDIAEHIFARLKKVTSENSLSTALLSLTVFELLILSEYCTTRYSTSLRKLPIYLGINFTSFTMLLKKINPTLSPDALRCFTIRHLHNSLDAIHTKNFLTYPLGHWITLSDEEIHELDSDIIPIIFSEKDLENIVSIGQYNAIDTLTLKQLIILLRMKSIYAAADSCHKDPKEFLKILHTLGINHKQLHDPVTFTTLFKQFQALYAQRIITASNHTNEYLDLPISNWQISIDFYISTKENFDMLVAQLATISNEAQFSATTGLGVDGSFAKPFKNAFSKYYRIQPTNFKNYPQLHELCQMYYTNRQLSSDTIAMTRVMESETRPNAKRARSTTPGSSLRSLSLFECNTEQTSSSSKRIRNNDENKQEEPNDNALTTTP